MACGFALPKERPGQLCDRAWRGGSGVEHGAQAVSLRGTLADVFSRA